MDIQKQHEDFCKAFKPEFGTIFNIDSVQFEPLEDKYYQDAQRLNWAFAGWLQAAKAQALPEGSALIPFETLNEALSWANCASNESWTDAQREEIDKHYEVIEKSMLAAPQEQKFNLDEFLVMEQKLKSKGGIIKADLDRFIAYAEMVLEKTKALKEPK